MNPSIRDVEEIFFEAMRNGYAESAKKTSILALPSSKTILFEKGDWKVVDCYFVRSDSDNSSGTTMIWYKENLVWIMYYGGWYVKAAIPFLKQCLSEAYSERVFYGGRGKESIQGENFNYINTIKKNDFEYFDGQEAVFETMGGCVGSHWYRGMSLLPKADQKEISLCQY